MKLSSTIIKQRKSYPHINSERLSFQRSIASPVVAPKDPFYKKHMLGNSNTFKAAVLSLVTIFTIPSFNTKAEEILVDASASIKSELVDSITSLNAQESINKGLDVLSKKIPAEKSYYFSKEKSNLEIYKIKLEDYNNLVNNVPKSIANKGDAAVLLFKKSIISILDQCGEYGAMYIKNIPDLDNIVEHANGISRLLNAIKNIQGCSYENIAVLNGLSAKELLNKVVIPNEKLLNEEKIGENQNTVVIISHEFGSDPGNFYKKDFSTKPLNSKDIKIDFLNYKFNSTFLSNYDNILLVQPNKQTADSTLNTAFSNIEQGLEKGAKTDILYIGHGYGTKGAVLSNGYDSYNNTPSLIDLSDFKPIDNGGQVFAQSIARIFKNSIENGYNPRFIGDGCNSEFLQDAINNIMPNEYKESVHVFGTPYDSNGTAYLGFSADKKLSLVTKVSKFFKNMGLMIRITEIDPSKLEKIKKNYNPFYELQSFYLDRGLSKNIIADTKSGKNGTHGVAAKKNGMLIEYEDIEY